MSLEIKTQAEFFEALKQFFIANQDRITDLNKGSALYTQLQAFATQLNSLMVKASGGFKGQFEQMPYEVFNFQKKDSSFASATVIFSIQSSETSDITVPIGTVVSTSGGLLYTTEEVATILAGNTDSNAVSVIAESSGSDYNVFAGEINIINSSVSKINSVTNDTSAVGGVDEESVADYFTRFRTYILGLQGSNRYGIFTASTNIENVQSVFIEDHFPPKSDIYNYTIHVDDGSGNVPQTKLDEIKLVIYGNDTATYQGYNSAGINFDVLSAGLVSIDIIYELEIDTEETDVDTATGEADSQITNYINSLWVGSDVIWTELIRLVKGINGVTDVPTLTLNGLSENVETTESQVARVNSITGSTA